MSRPHLPAHFTERFMATFSTALAAALHHEEFHEPPPRTTPAADDWPGWSWENGGGA